MGFRTLDKIDCRKLKNVTAYIIRHNRDGTLDMKEYPINKIPKSELNSEVMEIVYEDTDNSIEIYVI